MELCYYMENSLLVDVVHALLYHIVEHQKYFQAIYMGHKFVNGFLSSGQLTRAANSVDFCIEFKFVLEFSLFHEFESCENLSSSFEFRKYSDSLSLSTFAVKLRVQTYVQTSDLISKCRCHNLVICVLSICIESEN